MGGGDGGTPAPGENEKALAQVSQAQWGQYVEKYHPVNDRLIKETRATADKVAQAQGAAGADSAAAFSGLAADTVKADLVSGAQIGSGRANLGQESLAASSSEASSRGSVAGKQGVENNQLTADIKLSAFGRQLADDSTLGFSQSANRETALTLANSQAKFEKNQNKQAAVASVLGAATKAGIIKYNEGRGNYTAADLAKETGVDLDNPFAAAATKASDPFSGVTGNRVGVNSPLNTPFVRRTGFGI